MAGAALRGFGRALLKKAKPSYPKAKPRGTPTKAGLVARRAALRGDDPKTKLMGGVRKQFPPGEKAPPSIKKTAKEIGKVSVIAGLAYAAGKSKATKEAKAKEKKKKLKEAAEEHKKKTEEKRKKHGKHHYG